MVSRTGERYQTAAASLYSLTANFSRLLSFPAEGSGRDLRALFQKIQSEMMQVLQQLDPDDLSDLVGSSVAYLRDLSEQEGIDTHLKATIANVVKTLPILLMRNRG